MKNALFTLFFVFLFPGIISAAYTGHVYLDNNADSTFNKGDTPLSGVAVTDGQHVTKTDKNGLFSLPGYAKTRFITITTPSGYRVRSHFIPVEASGKSYDFILAKNNQPTHPAHQFIQITDTEIFGRGVDGTWVDYLKQYVKNESISFVVHTGDICYESGLKSHIKIVNSETIGCPVYYCIGNHDLVKGDYGEQLFESIYGPTWFSFEYGNTHYIVTPMAGGDARPSYTTEEVHNWLKNDLAQTDPNKAVIVFNHDILTRSNDFLFGPKDQKTDLRKHNLKAWIYGHLHINYVRNQGGIYTVCTSTLDKGGIDHSTSAFRVVTMDDKSNPEFKLHYCFVEPQVVIASPAHETITPLLPSGKIPLSVNAYHSGSTVKKVSCTVSVQGNTSRHQTMDMQPLSDWNWYAEINPQPAWNGQQLLVSVTAELTNGKTVVSSSNFIYDKNFSAKINLKDNWTALLGDAQHTGKSTAVIEPPLQLAWVKNIGANIFMSSPLMVDNKIIVASCDDNGKPVNGVFALDANNGNVLWKFPTRNSIKNSIAYDNGFVFAQDAEGYLYALDSNTGKLQWERNVADDPYSYIAEGLVAENGIVYAGTGRGLTAFKVQDGSKIWQNPAWKGNEGASTTLTTGEGVLVAGAHWSALYGNDLKTGSGLWKLNQDGLSDRGGSPVLHNGLFYLISRKSIFIIEPQTGKIVKQKEIPERNLENTSTPLITDDRIIFGTADKGIIALDKESLAVIWNTPTGQSLVYTTPYTTTPFATVESSPVLSNGTVYFGASDGYLYGLKAKTGEIVWKVQTGAPSFASMAISGNTLIATDFSGNVYGFVSPLKSPNL
ncbi:phosphoesterase [Bacteroidia bacterium]|nr:phosphoesterase [Bacteroidia bacterium]